MKKISINRIHVAIICLVMGNILTAYTSYQKDIEHTQSINQLIKQSNYQQPVVTKAVVDNLESRILNLENELDNSRELNYELTQQLEQKHRTNVRPEYEKSNTGQTVRNSDTFEQAMANCDMEANVINFAMYGEPHPSCR